VLFLAPMGGQGRRIAAARALKDDMVVVRLEGVASREAAAALTGTSLYIDRTALPAADEDEFYHADLVGLPVRTTAGIMVGTITALLDFGAGDLLEIATVERETRLIPFARAFVPVVDIAGGVVIVTPEAVAPADEGGDDEAMGNEAGDRSP
jgi:16S rRNA processing protein RimM